MKRRSFVKSLLAVSIASTLPSFAMSKVTGPEYITVDVSWDDVEKATKLMRDCAVPDEEWGKHLAEQMEKDFEDYMVRNAGLALRT